MQGGSLHCLLCHCAHAYALPRLTFQPPSQSDTPVACRLNLVRRGSVRFVVVGAASAIDDLSCDCAVCFWRVFDLWDFTNISCPGGKRHRSNPGQVAIACSASAISSWR